MAIASWAYSFSLTVTEPPTGSQIRFDAAAPYTAVTKVWVRYLTADGIDVFRGLMTTAPDSALYLQDKDDHTRFVHFTTIGAAIDKGGYVEIPVVWQETGAALVAQLSELVIKDPAPAPPEPWPEPPPPSVVWIGAPAVQPLIRSVLALPIATEPLTLDDGKLRAGLDWPAGDPRDQLMLGFISAARQQVEADTALAVAEQTRDLLFDTLPSELVEWRELPSQSSPLTSVTALSWADSNGVIIALDPTAYTITISNAGLLISVPLPPASAVRWILRIVAGFGGATPAQTIPPALLQAVGLLTAHYATLGRDLATIERGTLDIIPQGYDALISAYRPETLV
jgi:uncharacterized phiE125 gp8 family phage protein